MNDERSTGLGFLEQPSGNEISRRDFFKSAGSGIFLLFTMGDSLFSAQDRQGRPQRGVPSDFNAFLKIGEDGRVSCYVGKIEMGQGVVTSLGQMLADELDVTLDSVDMVMGDTDLCPWDMGTFGSLSTRSFGPSLRMAGAEARQVLLELGAEHLKVPPERLSTENGHVVDKGNKQHKVSYAELAKGKKIERRPTGTVSVKKHPDFKIMNKAHTRRDAEEKVTGKARYAGDIHLPGMLYAKILRPPSHDSKLIDADVSEAKKVDGVQVVKEGDLIAVLHKYPDIAESALSKVQVKFDTPKSDLDDTNIFEHLLKVAPAGKVVAKDGNLQSGASEAKEIVEATYFNDYVAHAPMEPHAAIANVEGNKATVWTSTQNPFTARDEIAKGIGFPPENVRVITPYVGGGFGGKTRNLQAVEAARLSKITGKPVQVMYSRKE
jgi:nicotinate dehydrogenase subunit B